MQKCTFLKNESLSLKKFFENKIEPFILMKKVLFLFILALHSAFTFSQTEKPKLVVGIVVDQMCYDYLYRFYDQFGKDGFKRLMQKGSNFRNVTYNYVPTYTGPGHASIYTGTTPANHGIVANDWFHRPYDSEVNCVDDTTVLAIGGDQSEGACSPHFLLGNTITDQLKLSYPKAKVISVSIKDRGAILPGGHLSDGSFWYDYTNGKFITSSFYTKELPDWHASFYEKNPFSSYANQVWKPLKEAANYTFWNADNSKYEGLIMGKTQPTFPYDLSQFSGVSQIQNFTAMPFANTYLTDFALHAMRSEKLGKSGETDMLCISYSTPDICGHTFGPYSLEIEDMYYRLDAELSKLFKTLDQEIGKGEYVVFLTADHAVVPVPQQLMDLQLPGGYVYMNELTDFLRKASQDEFQTDIIDRIENNNVYLKSEYIHSNTSEMFTEFIQKKLETYPNIKAAFTNKQLKSPNLNGYAAMIAQGYDSERSGEVIFMFDAGFLGKSSPASSHTGTSHGTAFNYDTHVPVLFYGKNVPKQDVFTAYEITDIAASLVHVMNLQRPNIMTGKPMVELFRKK